MERRTSAFPQKSIDLVITDLVMPKMDGIELWRIKEAESRGHRHFRSGTIEGGSSHETGRLRFYRKTTTWSSPAR
jgi:hypothetical protein